VRITIPGEALDPSVFDCSSGQVLFDQFYPGTYAVTVDALDATIQSPPTAVWSGSQTTNLRGDTKVDVVLQPVRNDNAVAYLSWSFAPASGQAPQCGSGQTLDSVAIFIDGASTNLAYACADGLAPKQALSPYLPPGDHTVQLVASNAAEGQTAYAQTAAVTVHFATGSAPSQSLTMNWRVGGLAMSWGAYPSLAAYQANPNQPLPCAS